MRKTQFSIGEHYHVYNRGVDKRSIFGDVQDAQRFLLSIREFNTLDPIGSLYEHSRKKENDSPRGGLASKLVHVVAFCLNQNHFHFLLSPLVDNGVQKFMHRLSTGYTMHFNDRYERTGSLLQGPYKAIHIDSNEYLLHISAYINLNARVHSKRNKPWLEESKFSSISEYSKKTDIQICNKAIVLDQFESRKQYMNYAIGALSSIIARKSVDKSFGKMLLD